jgi:hypothetical protein
MDLSFVVNDPLDAEQFQVLRSQGGAYGPGGWDDQYTTLNYYGIITPNGSPREVEAVPEADRVHGWITINCELPLYVTDAARGLQGSTSDLVLWSQGDGCLYRVLKTHNYASRGYWWAVATRILGN